MNNEQQKELLDALVDLRKRVDALERRQARFEQLAGSLRTKVDSTVKITSKIATAIKQASSRIMQLKERLSSAESAIRHNTKQ